MDIKVEALIFACAVAALSFKSVQSDSKTGVGGLSCDKSWLSSTNAHLSQVRILGLSCALAIPCCHNRSFSSLSAEHNLDEPADGCNICRRGGQYQSTEVGPGHLQVLGHSHDSGPELNT